ncbi:DUF6363 domain-containing protein, partial [Bifidobacterium bifidum]|uniref:DUF6363 domain-containing protein n=1 Tax=Bifidobacterium bifidum TaxID=1681 RepID=UPI003015651C|nr:patatin family protein [Bifidobacterium bifidum]
QAAQALRTRAKVYNDEMTVARQYAAEGRLLIVCPDDTYGLDTLSKTRQGLLDMYNDGVGKAQKIVEFLAGSYDE